MALTRVTCGARGRTRDLLVSPVVVEGASSHDVALPPGDWVHAATGDTHTGDTTVTVPAPIDAAPVFARADSWPRLREVFHP